MFVVYRFQIKSDHKIVKTNIKIKWKKSISKISELLTESYQRVLRIVATYGIAK